MTAHELARKLLELPDVTVTIRGYEGGVNIVKDITDVGRLETNVNEEWYYGKHEFLYDGDNPDNEKSVIIPAVQLLG